MEEWERRWPDFSPDEVLCKEHLFLWEKRGILAISPAALDVLQSFRTWLREPLIVNNGKLRRRGSRSLRDVYEVNRDTRGGNRAWEWSFHLWCAFDISSSSMIPDALFNKVLEFNKSVILGFGGIGLYSSFVHVDCRMVRGNGVVIWEER